VTIETTPMVVRRIQLLNQLDPRPPQITSLVNANRGGKMQAKILSESKQKVQYLTATDADELTAVAKVIAKNSGLLVQADPFFFTQRTRIAELANSAGVPAMYPLLEYVEAGGLMSYGPNLDKAYRQVGQYAAMILDGAKPSSLPLLQSSPHTLAINLKTARRLKLEIPPMLLARADHIIE
jgi:putative ABC transport system substrate-binding protein